MAKLSEATQNLNMSERLMSCESSTTTIKLSGIRKKFMMVERATFLFVYICIFALFILLVYMYICSYYLPFSGTYRPRMVPIAGQKMPTHTSNRIKAEKISAWLLGATTGTASATAEIPRITLRKLIVSY